MDGQNYENIKNRDVPSPSQRLVSGPHLGILVYPKPDLLFYISCHAVVMQQVVIFTFKWVCPFPLKRKETQTCVCDAREPAVVIMHCYWLSYLTDRLGIQTPQVSWFLTLSALFSHRTSFPQPTFIKGVVTCVRASCVIGAKDKCEWSSGTQSVMHRAPPAGLEDNSRPFTLQREN